MVLDPALMSLVRRGGVCCQAEGQGTAKRRSLLCRSLLLPGTFCAPPLMDSDTFLFATFFYFFSGHSGQSHFSTIIIIQSCTVLDNCILYLYINILQIYILLPTADANASDWVVFLFYFSSQAVGLGQIGEPGQSVAAMDSMVHGSQSFSARPAGLLEPDLPGGSAKPDRQ